MMLQIILLLTKIKYKFMDLVMEQRNHMVYKPCGTSGSVLVLYQCTDLSELQPDAHKYIPLFLPLCGCQLGWEKGLFWVFSVYSNQSRAFTFLIGELC